ncbi:MAG TPA: flagellar biosynthesis anti-sigma factor FlgM [Spirochaetota bacterium]|nr:flagellar biosynthesis anti-sigma factor FlgM [Spirochaetota bacterium]HPC42401.1 flagellar biosynthesis anti-sigma factor FlgM [Spirochaetota bacterium]HPL17417.1 flagellar biosynthesis anti-sigma factor FlgM [Spirochaetota bacterium]HQF08010.1 flagellar biosynthesis anti-sigma factor FlgM [Spirochaetota bacterium]HQH96570.1 flagellar biosynthesis anti-sigma factor FlgM [Spirochaetota bacterium]
MMINKTTEYRHYGKSMQSEPERSPRFLRRVTTEGKGADIVDISEAARMRMLEKSNTPLVKSIMSFSREIGEMVRALEKDYDTCRAARIEELRRQVRLGSYDFDDGGRIGTAADSLLKRKEIRHRNSDCA